MNIKKTHIFLILFLLVLLLISSFYYPLVGADAGYYLAMSKNFYLGKIYFIEIATIYNPLSIITLGLPFLFSNHPDPRFALLINFIIIFLSGILLYKILKLFSNNKTKNIFFSIYFVVSNLVLDGSSIIIEPLSVLFLLISLYYYFKFKDIFLYRYLLIVGIAISLSFFSKQYSLFIIAPFLIDIISNKIKIFKKVLIIFLGFFIPVCFFFLYLIHYGSSIYECFRYLIGKGINIERGNGTGSNYTLFTYTIGFFIFIAYNLYVIVFPSYLFKFFNNLKNSDTNKSILLILLLFFSCSVLYFATFLHYFQYVLPFAILCYVNLSETVSLKIEKYSSKLYITSIILIFISSAYSFSKKKGKFIKQEIIKTELLKNIPAKSKVYLDGISPAYYFICDYKSIDLKEIGFTFPGYFYNSTILNKLQSNSYIVTSENLLKYYKIDNDNKYEIRKVIINNEPFYIIKKIINE